MLHTIASARLRANRRVFLASSAAFGSIGFLGITAGAATLDIKVASDNTVDQPQAVRLVQMWAAIEKESGGRIQAKVFPNSALGNTNAMFEQMRVGALQFSLTPSGVLAGVVPAADIAYLGFGYKDQDEGMRALTGPLGAYVRAQADAKGILQLDTPWDAGMQQIGITSNWRPIRTPDDMRGFKVRIISSPILLSLFKEFGANATTISIGEVYTSLQAHLIDGEASSLASTEAFRFYETLKYISITNHVWSTYLLLSSNDYWKTVPHDLQEIIMRNNRKFALLVHRDMLQLNDSLQNKLTRQGMAFNVVDQAPFRARLRGYYQTWATHFGPTEWGLLETALGHKLT